MILVDGEPIDVVPATDRGFQYGDGVFETLACDRGRILALDAHLDRLQHACRTLGIREPDRQSVREDLDRLAQHSRDAQAVIKLVVTRGGGGRGYAPHDTGVTRRVASVWPWPRHVSDRARAGIHAKLCETRLARQPLLAGLKHLNRLEQVMASREIDEASGIAEGLMLDTDDHLVCGIRSNLFAVVDGGLVTPSLGKAGIAGVVRAAIIEAAPGRGIPVDVREVGRELLDSAQELFVTNSIIGVWPIVRIDERRLQPGPVTGQVREWLVADGIITP